MFLSLIFSQSAAVQLLLLTGFGVFCYAAALGYLWVLRRRYRNLSRAVPVSTFISTIATAWALALGFAAADVWSARAQAEQAVSEERSAIIRLIGIAGAYALDLPQIMKSLARYQHEVRETEWGTGYNRTPLQSVDAALQQIRVDIVKLAQSGVPGPLVGKMTRDFDELQDARNTRLAIGTSSVSTHKWNLVLFLTLLSMVAIAATHADRPTAARNALSIFMVAAVVSLWFLALHATPYSGSAGIRFSELHLPSEE